MKSVVADRVHPPVVVIVRMRLFIASFIQLKDTHTHSETDRERHTMEQKPPRRAPAENKERLERQPTAATVAGAAKTGCACFYCHFMTATFLAVFGWGPVYGAG